MPLKDVKNIKKEKKKNETYLKSTLAKVTLRGCRTRCLVLIGIIFEGCYGNSHQKKYEHKVDVKYSLNCI